MDLEPPLDAQECRKQSDGTGTRDNGHLGVEEGATTDPVDLLPRLGHDRRRFEEDPDISQPRVETHQTLRIGPPTVTGESVQTFDAVLGVFAVSAHVPLAPGARRAGHRIRPADDPHDQITRRNARTSW